MDDLSDKYEEKSPFTVPEEYFETLEEQIMERVKRGKKTTKRGHLVQMMKPYLGLVGMCLFIWGTINWVLPRLNGESFLVRGIASEETGVEWDADFNPTRDEIIEYLAQEVDVIDFFD